MSKLHYTTVALELFRHRQMGMVARLGCSRHLQHCELCRQRLARLQEDDALVGELQESLRLLGDLDERQAEQ